MDTQDKNTGTEASGAESDFSHITAEDAKLASRLSIRWFKGETFAEIAASEGLDVATVERLTRTLMKGVSAVSRKEVAEYKGEVRRLRRLMASVAKGGFGEGALLTVVTEETRSGLQFHRFIVTAKQTSEATIMEACRPHLEALFARIAPMEKGQITSGPAGLEDVRDEDTELDDDCDDDTDE